MSAPWSHWLPPLTARRLVPVSHDFPHIFRFIQYGHRQVFTFLYIHQLTNSSSEDDASVSRSKYTECTTCCVLEHRGSFTVNSFRFGDGDAGASFATGHGECFPRIPSEHREYRQRTFHYCLYGHLRRWAFTKSKPLVRANTPF